MNRFRWFTTGAAMAMAMATIAPAQVPLSPDINLFGDDFPQQPPQRRRIFQGRVVVQQENKSQPVTPGYAQTLVFDDGRELRGELVEITKDELLWRRPDTSETLRFARGGIRKLIITATEENAPVAGRTSVPSTPATLKLPGGDWLFGNVTSADGQTFAVQLADAPPLKLARPQVEWLQFSPNPVPAFGFSGTALDMEGWMPGSVTMEVVDKTLTVKGSSWIGRQISPPKRFEVAFELPEDTEEGTQLWLQPFGPQPNCFGTGTAQIRFGKKQITYLLYINKFENQTVPLSKEAQADRGPAKYRVFYDGGEKRVIVRRNGREVGDWKFFPPKDKEANEVEQRDFQFNGLCFDREDRGQSGVALKFNQLRVQPWDGVLPKEGETADGQDRLSGPDGAPLTGKLESVTAKELRFSGEPHTRQTGIQVRLGDAPPSPLAGAEAKLEFGPQGEFAVRHLEIRAGLVHGETSFANALELPIAALQQILFPPSSPAASPPTDLLVFKNGDELSGQALSAAWPGAVRWRTMRGQEVEIQPGRVAGIRLAGAAELPPGPAPSAALLELRTGERLRGKLLTFDEKEVQMEHAQLGPIALERSRLWQLFPNPRLEVFDGGRTPGGWTWTNPAAEKSSKEPINTGSGHWVYLDGTYILRGGGDSSSFSYSELPGLQHEIAPALERFELRVESTSPLSTPANFILMLSSKEGATLNATISYSDLQLVVMNAQRQRQPRWRNIPFQEKLGNATPQRALRLFVDTRTGTCDIYLNGVLLTRVGVDASERLLKASYTARLAPYPNQGGVTIFSNLWIGPWNGELPRPGELAAGATSLANGDVAPGLPKTMHDGKITIDSILGELDLPMEKTLAVDFGGALDAPPSPARIRLADGTAVNVEGFQWDGHELMAHSATFGDLRLPAAAVQELIYAPAPPHPPAVPPARKVAQKDPAKDNDPALLR